MKAKWKAKSSTLPEQTIITQPKTEKDIHQDYENYVNQMIGSARKWDMNKYILNKTYEIEGNKTTAFIDQSNGNFGIRFVPVDGEPENENSNSSQKTNKKKSCVITSYSIHYTKLYDFVLLYFLEKRC